jgi:preprotein translocase subunit SecF
MKLRKFIFIIFYLCILYYIIFFLSNDNNIINKEQQVHNQIKMKKQVHHQMKKQGQNKIKKKVRFNLDELFSNTSVSNDIYHNNVEKVNKINQNINNNIGKKVKDIYDDLVQNNVHVNKKCIMKGENNNWEYENENVLNGGLFTKNIYGIDPNDDYYFAI